MRLKTPTLNHPMTTGEITKAALKLLDLMGFEAWRQNQVNVPGRGFTGKRGLSDIIGYDRKDASFLFCEVKNRGDSLSDLQKELLDHAKSCGCRCFIATVTKTNQFQLNPY